MTESQWWASVLCFHDNRALGPSALELAKPGSLGPCQTSWYGCDRSPRQHVLQVSKGAGHGPSAPAVLRGGRAFRAVAQLQMQRPLPPPP